MVNIGNEFFSKNKNTHKKNLKGKPAIKIWTEIIDTDDGCRTDEGRRTDFLFYELCRHDQAELNVFVKKLPSWPMPLV